MSSGDDRFTHSFTLENPETGEEEDFEMDVLTTWDEGVWTRPNGDPGDPPSSETELIDWWRVSDSSKPKWVTQKMIDDELNAIE